MSTPLVIDCDPGHDDAIAILLALASPEVELRGVTTVAGNQTLDKTTRNALQVLEVAGRVDVPVAPGADRPLRRELRTAAHVHGESGLDGPSLPGQLLADPIQFGAVTRIHRHHKGAAGPQPGVDAVPGECGGEVRPALQRRRPYPPPL